MDKILSNGTHRSSVGTFPTVTLGNSFRKQKGYPLKPCFLFSIRFQEKMAPEI